MPNTTPHPRWCTSLSPSPAPSPRTALWALSRESSNSPSHPPGQTSRERLRVKFTTQVSQQILHKHDKSIMEDLFQLCAGFFCEKLILLMTTMHTGNCTHYTDSKTVLIKKGIFYFMRTELRINEI